MEQLPVSEVLPGLYRAVLDAVARLEAHGRRREAGAIRAEATATYSKAWNSAAEGRLRTLRTRADRIIERSAPHRSEGRRATISSDRPGEDHHGLTLARLVPMDTSTAAQVLDPGLTGQDARPVDGVDNGYLAGYRVRFDEAAPDGNLRTSALLRYAQDIAWRHSEQLGFDRAWYRDRGLGWVVRGVELELAAPIPLGTTLRVSTAVVGHRRIWARRLGECRFADGRLAARITTDWVLLDARGRIVRIPDDFGVAFANPEVKSEILRVPAETAAPAARHSLTVRPSDLDPIDHVNNAVYVDWLEEAIEAIGWTGGDSGGESDGELGGRETAAGSAPGTLRIEYLSSAARGEAIEIDLFGSPDAWRGRIGRADGLELVRAARDLSRSSTG